MRELASGAVAHSAARGRGAPAAGSATAAPEAAPVPAPAPELSPAAAKAQAQKLALEAVDQLQNGDELAARATLERAAQLDPGNDLARKLADQIRADAQRELGPVYFRYTVQKDDTLSKLAQQFLGDRFRFYILAKYNDITNPSRLAAGQVIRVPGRAPPPAAAATPHVDPAPTVVAPPPPEPKPRDDVADALKKVAELERAGNLEAAYFAYTDLAQRYPASAEAGKAPRCLARHVPAPARPRGDHRVPAAEPRPRDRQVGPHARDRPRQQEGPPRARAGARPEAQARREAGHQVGWSGAAAICTIATGARTHAGRSPGWQRGASLRSFSCATRASRSRSLALACSGSKRRLASKWRMAAERSVRIALTPSAYWASPSARRNSRALPVHSGSGSPRNAFAASYRDSALSRCPLRSASRARSATAAASLPRPSRSPAFASAHARASRRPAVTSPARTSSMRCSRS